MRVTPFLLVAILAAMEPETARAQTPCGAGAPCPAGTACYAGTCVSFGGAAQPVYTPPRERPVAHRPERTRGSRPGRAGLGMVIGGAATLGAGWVLEILVSLFAGYQDRTMISIFGSPGSSGGTFAPGWDDFRWAGLIPIVGPWIQLAVERPRSDDLWDAWVVVDGLVQGIGTVLLAIGGGMMAAEDRPRGTPIAILPTVGPEHAGLVLAVPIGG